MTTPSRSVILPLSKKLIANSNVLCHFAALKPENIAMTMRNFIPMGITAMIENFIGNVNLTTEGPHLLQVINNSSRAKRFWQSSFPVDAIVELICVV